MPPASKTTVEIDGRRLSLSNLDKVLFPEAGFTKGQVIDYYTRIAPVIGTHLGDRIVTLRRFPNGVSAPGFFEKRCPPHHPDWISTAAGPGDGGDNVDYCVLGDRPAVVWAANLAALELHTPMSRAPDPDTPTMVVFDLDPGDGTGIKECAAVALEIRDLLDNLDLQLWPKTSGSKGLQVYVPLNDSTDYDHTARFALAVAQVLEHHHPDRIVSKQDKALRRGKVLVDWSQNSRHKTTVCAYSLRARPRPTVSTPVTWDEVDAAAAGEPLTFETEDVLDRVEVHGDLFADVTSLQQQLPALPATD
jgi:bifunctional non-homologous end joining protein LigD